MPYKKHNQEPDYSKEARAKRRKKWMYYFIGKGHTRKIAIQLAKWAEKNQ